MEMAFFKICAALVVVGVVSSTPSPHGFWKGTAFDSTVEQMRSMCNENDALACLQFKTITFLDNLFQKDSYKLSDNVEIYKNSYRSNEITARSETTLEDKVEEYVKSHDVSFKLPVVGSTVTLDAKNLDLDEVNVKLSFSDPENGQARKSKMKKIFIPILVFILLKAMTLIPLALGILGLKAWNALQLSFFSFVVSMGLAVFQLCKKLASDSSPPQIAAAHSPWDAGYNGHYGRSFDVSTDAQNLAYSAYRQQ